MDTKQQPELTKKERKEQKRKEKEAERVRQIKARKMKKYVKRSLVVLAILAVGFGFWQLSQQSSISPTATADILQVQNDDYTKGNANASVVLVEYLDFECEACGAYYPLVKRLSAEYGEKVLFVSRYFPLPGHKNGMTSALAVEAAGKQGKYWEMHDILFENQRDWGERESSDSAIFEAYAEQVGLNMEQFKQDVNSKEVKNRVTRDRNEANRLGVNATPTFFLNGEKIQNPRGYEAFVALIEKELEGAGGQAE
jgi:protein-disulfide isomerase